MYDKSYIWNLALGSKAIKPLALQRDVTSNVIDFKPGAIVWDSTFKSTCFKCFYMKNRWHSAGSENHTDASNDQWTDSQRSNLFTWI